jgi:hypothetical protein
MPYYLCLGNDTLDRAERCETVRDAILTYREVAEELSSYGQRLDATVHKAAKRSECDEYPDYVLSMGPRGGVRCERA